MQTIYKNHTKSLVVKITKNENIDLLTKKL